MRRIHATCLLATLMVVLTALPVSAGTVISSAGVLTDLNPTAQDATDGARARARSIVAGERTVVRLQIDRLDPTAAGTAFGAHVHVGPCVAGDGAAALGHYNTGGDPSPETEVWLDFTATSGGTAQALAIVPFHIDAGAAQSIVIHALPTAPDGAAGTRLACLPMEF